MSSIWTKDVEIEEQEPLRGEVRTQVAIIGAGLAGLLTGYMLRQKGVDALIIDEKELASGTTQNTTAKITSQHDLIYNQLIHDLGIEKAQQYATANELAVKKYSEMAKKIDCDFVTCPSYVYSLTDNEQLYKETDAARKLGIAAEFTTETELPFKTMGAVRFDRQARFHPLKFIKAISRDLTVYEHTKALEIEDKTIKCEHAAIHADQIVITTHFPFINTPGYYFLRLYQSRSYVLALEHAQKINGMYVDAQTEGLSFRDQNGILIFGGADHRTGESEKSRGFSALRESAHKLYPDSTEVAAWATQDCMPLDDVPYIGHYSKKFEHIFVATGFRKWGMTSSMVSAMILSDQITGKKNEYEKVFCPQRILSGEATKSILVNTYKTAVDFISQRINPDPDKIKEILPDHSGIIEYEGQKYGVYKNQDGEVFVVSTKCPHLGCELTWNDHEKSWDCPCHGSRFDYKGKLLSNPATRDADTPKV